MKLNKYLIHDKKEVIKFIQDIFPKSFKFDFDKQLVKDMDGRFYTLNDTIQEDHILKIKLLFLSSLQQFQFWVVPHDNSIRTSLTSWNIHNLSNLKSVKEFEVEMIKLIGSSAYLRKERLETLKNSLIFLQNVSSKLGKTKSNDLEVVDNLLIYLYNYSGFLIDPFHKKRNYFIMSVMRYFSVLLEEDKNSIFKPITNLDVNPAIDYNIPPILDKIGVVNFSKEIKNILEQSVVLSNGSYTELLIRAYSYIAMLKFAKTINLNQEVLDGNLFFPLLRLTS